MFIPWHVPQALFGAGVRWLAPSFRVQDRLQYLSGGSVVPPRLALLALALFLGHRKHTASCQEQRFSWSVALVLTEQPELGLYVELLAG